MKLKRFLKAAFLATGMFLFMPLLADAASHTVVKGDTLYGLSKKYNTTVSSIKELNNLQSNLIRIGQVLVISKEMEETKVEQAPQQAVAVQSDAENSSYKEYTMLATAFTASCKGCSGITAYGINLKKNPGAKVIAVDPKVIPLGTKVYVEGYGEAIAGDTGGSIKGNKIDVFYPTRQMALDWGRRTVTVKVYQ